MLFQNSSTQYIDNICTNMHDHFDPVSLGHNEELNQLLNQKHMPADNCIIDCGEDELKQLLTHFQDLLPINRQFTHYN